MMCSLATWRTRSFGVSGERTTVARAVAIHVAAYRAEHKVSQTALGRMLDMTQPAIARLEIGEHEPTFAMLSRLSRGLGINFHIDITAHSLSVSLTAAPYTVG